MIREFLRQTFVTYGLIVLAVTIVPLIFLEDYLSQPVVFLLQLFVLTLIIRLSLLLVQYVELKTPLIEYVVDFVIVTVEVMGTGGTGMLFGWVTKESRIIFPIIIIFVFISVYVLNALRIQKDIQQINDQIQLRKRVKKEFPSE